MRFIIFTKGDQTVASSRYRGYYLAEELQRMGHVTEVIPTTSYSCFACIRYLRLLLSARHAGAVLLQRTIYNKYFFVSLLIAHALGVRFIFDIDDAVYEHSPIKTTWFTRNATFVTCGSKAVLEWVLVRNPNATLLTNGIPLSLYKNENYEARAEEDNVIGWIGDGPAHYENLRIIPPILAMLKSRNVPFRFRLIGTLGDLRVEELFNEFPEAELITSLDWADVEETVRHVSRFTVGIMPLKNTAWNQAKNFKALEYLACAVPAVVSPRASLKEMFEAGECVLFAETEDEWARAIMRLLKDREERELLGMNGLRLVEQNYSTAAMARSFLKIVTATGINP